MTTQPSLTPAAFAAKWRGVTTTEKAAAQEHFIDLCRLLGEATPHEADPVGANYAFEKRVVKAGGGDGFADVWKRDFFAWEYKGRNKDLRAAYVQLMTSASQAHVGYNAYDALWSSDWVPTYAEQVIADEFEDHQRRAGRRTVTAGEAEEVWDHGFLPRRNVRRPANTRLLIGRTVGGRRVTLVSRHLGDGIWFTYTGWDTKEADQA